MLYYIILYYVMLCYVIFYYTVYTYVGNWGNSVAEVFHMIILYIHF